MSSAEDVIKPGEITTIKESSQPVTIKESTTIEESNASNNILTNPVTHNEDLLKFYHAKVTIRSSLHWLRAIRNRLQENKKRLQLFNETVFSEWINIKSVDHDNHLLNHVLQHQRKVEFESKEFGMKFDIGDHHLDLGRREFSFLTGFSVGNVKFPEVKAGDVPPLVRRLFPEKVPGMCNRPKGVSYNVKGEELLDFVKVDEKWRKISDGDAVRFCLLLMSEHVFMGRETNRVVRKPIMMLAEDLKAWDNFPWGEYFWAEFYKRTVNLVHKNREKYSEKLKTYPLTQATYCINGFAWFLKVWILETFPNSHRWWFKDPNVFPRCLAWSDTNKRFGKNNYGELLREGSNPTLILTPTKHEINQEWFRKYHDFYEECWNTTDLLKIADDEQWEDAVLDTGDPYADAGESRGKGCVKEYETSMTGIELQKVLIDVTNALKTVVKNQEKLTEEVASLRKENAAATEKAKQEPSNAPDDVPTMALCDESMMIKVTNILQTVINNQDKLTEEVSYLQKGNAAANEKAKQEPSKATDNVHTMALDKDPKVCKDEEPKTSTALNYRIPADDVQFMDLEEDAKPRIYELPNPSTTLHAVITTNDGPSMAFDDFQSMASDDVKSMASDDDAKNKGAEYMNEELRNGSHNKGPLSEKPYLPFGMHTRSKDYQSLHNQSEVKLVQDNAKVDDSLLVFQDKEVVYEQADKSIKVEQQEPGRDVISRKRKRTRKPGPTQRTPWTRQKRRNPSLDQQRNKGAIEQSVYRDACKEIPAWTEILTRPTGACKSKPSVPVDMVEFLQRDGSQDFTFPWVEKQFTVGHNFWSRLLGYRPHRSGWLNDMHLDIWIRYMWISRPDSANWAMIGPGFCPQILGRGIPSSFYVTDILYPKGWWEVEKVYFPLNQEKIHWCLAELHISSGVITFYDTLGLGKEPEARDWWVKLRNGLCLKIPKLLTMHDVFRRKDIDQNSYKITFRKAQNAPRQGGKLGDCGVWVCILLYRLSCNLPLDVDDPLHTAMAYREQLAAFFWKHKRVD